MRHNSIGLKHIDHGYIGLRAVRLVDDLDAWQSTAARLRQVATTYAVMACICYGLCSYGLYSFGRLPSPLVVPSLFSALVMSSALSSVAAQQAAWPHLRSHSAHRAAHPGLLFKMLLR